MKPFEFFKPATIGDASKILADYGREGRALAGGTDLLIRMKRGQWTPRAVVSLNRIAALRATEMNGELQLGARVTLGEIIRSAEARGQFPVLARTASKMAGVQVRSLATVGGNLCNASPSADMAPPLIALGARADIAGRDHERILPLEDFFVGPGQNALIPGEILRAIFIPRPADGFFCSYVKLEHREAMDIAIAGVAVSAQLAKSAAEIRNCLDVRIVLGAVAPVPRRAKRAEEILRGNDLTRERIQEAARLAAGEAQPIDDVRGSAWYRRQMIEVLTRRQLLALMTAPL